MRRSILALLAAAVVQHSVLFAQEPVAPLPELRAQVVALDEQIAEAEQAVAKLPAAIRRWRRSRWRAASCANSSRSPSATGV